MKNVLFYMGIISFLTSCFVGKSKKAESALPVNSIYDVKIKTLDGKGTIKFKDYKGKYLVIVNTASECGYTYQYKDLQDFYTKYADSNVVVIGCPCNQFGGQEPGNAEQIDSFCKKNYAVTFPLTEKIEVKGPNQHPLYQWLTQLDKNGTGNYEVKWNFNKFVVGPTGALLYYFGSKVKPGDVEFLEAFRH